MAAAVVRLFPGVKLAIGPAIENGFYYDFGLEHKFTPEDLARIEAEMQRVVAENAPFKRFDLPRAEAHWRMESAGQPYKTELIEGFEEDRVSFYSSGSFTDVCAGPHLPGTGACGKAFKLLNVAGAYWRGDERNAMLQRIYGTAFSTQQALDEHLKRLEEAAQARPPRPRQAACSCSISATSSARACCSGCPRARSSAANWRTGSAANCASAATRTSTRRTSASSDLYRTSGHYPYYQDSQYPADRRARDARAALERGLLLRDALQPDGEGRGGRLPAQADELPAPHPDLQGRPRTATATCRVRLAEFGTVYRFEQSGELNGMTRVRGFTQDDAHLFCTPEQLEGEIESCVELAKLMLTTLGLTDYRVRVGLRDPTVGQVRRLAGELGEGRGEPAARREASSGMNAVEAVGEAAFYGPKIDFIVNDCIGREWQLGTVQVDYNLPERFGLEYIGADNAAHRPVMMHRAPFGSMERFIGILIEHFAGAFPLWLAPVQVRVLPIGEAQAEYAGKVLAALRAAGLRAEINLANEKIGAEDPPGHDGQSPVHGRRRREGGRAEHGLRARPQDRRAERDDASSSSSRG